MLDAVAFALLGVALGTFTGLVPGIHVNTVVILGASFIFLSLSFLFFFPFDFFYPFLVDSDGGTFYQIFKVTFIQTF
jgi:hypothetical protein